MAAAEPTDGLAALRVELQRLQARVLDLEGLKPRVQKLEFASGNSNTAKEQEVDVDVDGTPGGNTATLEALESRVKQLEEVSGVIKSKLPDEYEDEELEEYEINGSIWDASLAIGTVETHADMFLTLFALFGNIFIQILFCVIVYLNIASVAPIDEKALKGFLEWRVAVGHDAKHYDRGTQTSLVTRICAGAATTIMGTGQMDMYASLDAYAARASASNISPKDLISGPTLCFLSLLIWLLALLNEILNVVDWIRACLSVPRAVKTDFEEVDGGLQVVSISTHRFVLMLTVGFIRFGVAVFLCYTGLLFLAHTFSLEDLMVNAIMLAFILDMDEFIYENMAPKKVKDNLGQMQPIKLAKRLQMPGRSFMDPRVLVIVVFTLTVMATFFPMQVLATLKQVQDAQGLLCDGDKNFIFATDRASGIVSIAPTSSSAATLDHSYAFQAVLQRTNLVAVDGSTINVLADYRRPHETIYAQAPVHKVLDMLSESEMVSVDAMECRNTLSNNASALRRVQDMYGFTSSSSHWSTQRTQQPADQNITRCRDVEDRCTTSLTIRSLCPVRCGCDDPIRVLFDRKGCPTSCQTIARTRRASSIGLLNAQGRDADIMNATYINDWVMYFAGLQEYLQDLDFFNATNASTASRRLNTGTSTVTTTSTIVTWGSEALKRLGLNSWFYLGFANVSSSGLNLSHMALQSYQYAEAAGMNHTCRFVEFIPRLFDFDPCREDNGYSTTSRPFGSLRGLCPATCCLLNECLLDSNPETFEGRTAVRSWETLFGLHETWGLDFLVNLQDEVHACIPYDEYMCEFEMEWCPGYEQRCAGHYDAPSPSPSLSESPSPTSTSQGTSPSPTAASLAR